MSASREELVSLGFRWPVATSESLADGGSVTITPTDYLKSQETNAHSARARKLLRIYSVALPDGRVISGVSEIRVEEMLGMADKP
jgi:hypothetical protein